MHDVDGWGPVVKRGFVLGVLSSQLVGFFVALYLVRQLIPEYKGL